MDMLEVVTMMQQCSKQVAVYLVVYAITVKETLPGTNATNVNRFSSASHSDRLANHAKLVVVTCLAQLIMDFAIHTTIR